MLDFPNSPIAGQIFAAPNGVAYQWNSTYTAWLPVSMTSVPSVDFYSTLSGLGISSTGTWITVLWPAAMVGNSTGSYAPSTGRFTPPAGRYTLFASGSGNVGGSALTMQMKLRKNGIDVPNAYSVSSSPAAGTWCNVEVAANVDANGTDWFDIQVQVSALMSNSQGWFGAFALPSATPAPGIVGVPWRQIGRVVPSAGATSIDFQNIPADINDIELRFDVTPATNANWLYLQMYDNTGVLVTSTGYNWTIKWSASNAAGASNVFTYNHVSQSLATAWSLSGNVASAGVSSTTGTQGRIAITNIRDARAKTARWQTSFIEQTNVAYIDVVGSGGRTTPAALLSGLRLSWASGNFAAGGAVSLFGSP